MQTNSKPKKKSFRITLLQEIVLVFIILPAILFSAYGLFLTPKAEPLNAEIPSQGEDNKDFTTNSNSDHNTDPETPRPVEHKIEQVDGVTYIDGVLIVNKTYPLPDDYGNGITPKAQAAFEQMRQAAAEEGISLTIASGFRSYTTQDWLYHNYAAKDGVAEADRYSARPGYSEHQSGLAMDLNWVDTDFAYTPAGKWLHHNAWKYGFVLRYPEGSEDIAGFIYEPWHYRYVGKELASKLYNGGDWITLEEYFGIVSKYAD